VSEFYTAEGGRTVWRSPDGSEVCNFCGGPIGQGFIATYYQNWRKALQGLACTPCVSAHQEMSVEELDDFVRNTTAAKAADPIEGIPDGQVLNARAAAQRCQEPQRADARTRNAA
jgi:hypothetical protein